MINTNKHFSFAFYYTIIFCHASYTQNSLKVKTVLPETILIIKTKLPRSRSTYYIPLLEKIMHSPSWHLSVHKNHQLDILENLVRNPWPILKCHVYYSMKQTSLHEILVNILSLPTIHCLQLTTFKSAASVTAAIGSQSCFQSVLAQTGKEKGQALQEFENCHLRQRDLRFVIQRPMKIKVKTLLF